MINNSMELMKTSIAAGLFGLELPFTKITITLSTTQLALIRLGIAEALF